MPVPPGDLESEWAAIQDSRVAAQFAQFLGAAEDFEEDWDILQGGSCWFVALYDPQGQKIPGTTRRVYSLLQAMITWDAKPPVPVGDLRVGYWSRGRPTPVLMSVHLNESPPDLQTGRCQLWTLLPGQITILRGQPV